MCLNPFVSVLVASYWHMYVLFWPLFVSSVRIQTVIPHSLLILKVQRSKNAEWLFNRILWKVKKWIDHPIGSLSTLQSSLVESHHWWWKFVCYAPIFSAVFIYTFQNLFIILAKFSISRIFKKVTVRFSVNIDINFSINIGQKKRISSNGGELKCTCFGCKNYERARVAAGLGIWHLLIRPDITTPFQISQKKMKTDSQTATRPLS